MIDLDFSCADQNLFATDLEPSQGQTAVAKDAEETQAQSQAQSYGGSPPAGLSSPEAVDEAGPKPQKDLDPKAWLKRRREQIARASRKAREKRRNQVSVLQEENDRLRSERAGFLKTIADLQLKLSEIRNSGKADGRIENELLRAQLQEHKEFLSGCFKLHHGLPSTNNAFDHLYAKGCSFAKTYVHTLLSRSVREAWTPTKLPKQYFQALSPGYDVTASHRLVNTPTNRSLSVRIDFAFQDIPVDALAEAYWRMWSNVELIRQGFDIDFPIKITTLKVPGHSPESFGTYCYHEDVEPPKKPAEWVYVTSRTREKVVKSTLGLPAAQTPGLVRGLSREAATQAWLATSRAAHASATSSTSTTRAPKQTPSASAKQEAASKSRKRKRTKEAAPLGTFGKTNGWVLARCTTEHSPVESKEASRRRITSLLMEGGVLWEQGIIREDQDLEASFTDSQDTEHLVERDSCTRLAIVASMPLDVNMNILGSYKEVVLENGELSEKFCKALEMFYLFSKQIFQQIKLVQDNA
ncbi:Hypothetical Protein FCC1311_052712 [Hondaea fermentalgiana]|uniref:BZIP domain-containing protein n=1 Tax=Hondaea fermentalgiana TaxID=2315210 RepID=A0A2R5GFE0_9STRA|nr:Hypothetical Protein FCC1311_052712 [Hondaea fermentalgiana]|eukprot:GBG29049.1 Hypothetical Protein FCC1311_052712 [Hondaea fermentalgiana]